MSSQNRLASTPMESLPNLNPRLPTDCVTSIQSVGLSMDRQSVTTHGQVARDLSSRSQLESDVNTVGLSLPYQEL